MLGSWLPPYLDTSCYFNVRQRRNSYRVKLVEAKWYETGNGLSRKMSPDLAIVGASSQYCNTYSEYSGTDKRHLVDVRPGLLRSQAKGAFASRNTFDIHRRAAPAASL